MPFGFGVGFARPPRILSGISSPLAVANCVAWYRADLGIVPGTGVAGWNDQSGTGDANKNLAQATAGKQPALNSVDAAYNNKPTLGLASASGQFLASLAWAASIASPYTIITIGNNDGTGAEQIYTDTQQGAATEIVVQTSAGHYYISDGASISAPGPANNAAPQILATVFNGASSLLYLSAQTAALTANLSTDAFTGLTVGISSTDNAATAFNGKIAEVIVYSRALSAAEIAQLLNYGGARYGIAIGP